MSKSNVYVMSGNTPVFEFNTSDLIYTELNNELNYFRLKNTFKQFYNTGDYNKDLTRNVKIAEFNNNIIKSFLAYRVLLLSRKNAKKLFQSYRLDQRDDVESRVRLSIMCRAMSILDNYWIRPVYKNTKWRDINIRHRHLNEAVAQVALHNDSLSLQGSLDESAEFMTNGSYAKGWRRRKDGLWLYKVANHDSVESQVEIMVSNLLDKMNVTHCHYEEAYDDDLFVCACPAMTSDDLSILPGDIYESYLNRNEKSLMQEIIKVDSETFYKMCIVDYICANPDRHSQNWGMFFNPLTNEILGLHYLFDHNEAFWETVMDDENFPSHFGSNTLKGMAKIAAKRCNIFFTDKISKNDFMNVQQYDMFMHRVEQLGIETHLELKNEYHKRRELYSVMSDKRKIELCHELHTSLCEVQWKFDIDKEIKVTMQQVPDSWRTEGTPFELTKKWLYLNKVEMNKEW